MRTGSARTLPSSSIVRRPTSCPCLSPETSSSPWSSRRTSSDEPSRARAGGSVGPFGGDLEGRVMGRIMVASCWSVDTVQCSTAQHSTVTRRVASTRQRASTLAGAFVSRVVPRKCGRALSKAGSVTAVRRWSSSIRTSSHPVPPQAILRHVTSARPIERSLHKSPRHLIGQDVAADDFAARWGTRRAAGSFSFVKPFV